MRHALIGPIVFSLVLLSTGCSSEADKARAAAAKTIERVLKADEKLAKEKENLPPKATPSQIAWSIGVYCDGLERLEMSACPAPFKKAIGKLLTAACARLECAACMPRENRVRGLP